MDEGRRQFLKKMGLMGLLLLTPLVFLRFAFKAPTDDVDAFKEYYGLDGLGTDDLAGLGSDDAGDLEELDADLA